MPKTKTFNGNLEDLWDNWTDYGQRIYALITAGYQSKKDRQLARGYAKEDWRHLPALVQENMEQNGITIPTR